MSLARHYLDDTLAMFRQYKRLADRALAQIDDTAFFATLDEEGNSLAVIMKHLIGNMRSRWTDFLTTDGEKPDRNRDSEFIIDPGVTRADILDQWERNWELVFQTVQALQPTDAEREVVIRGEPHTVVQAINRQLTHYAYHVGQIVFLAKHYAAQSWASLTIPRGQSGTFNQQMQARTGR